MVDTSFDWHDNSFADVMELKGVRPDPTAQFVFKSENLQCCIKNKLD